MDYFGFMRRRPALRGASDEALKLTYEESARLAELSTSPFDQGERYLQSMRDQTGRVGPEAPNR